MDYYYSEDCSCEYRHQTKIRSKQGQLIDRYNATANSWRKGQFLKKSRPGDTRFLGAMEVEYTAHVSKAWKKSLSPVILRNLTGRECPGLEEIHLLGRRLGGRLGVPQEARG